jgi:hypothetical protein
MRTLLLCVVLAAAAVVPGCNCGSPPPDCTPGADGCACREGSQCDSGLVCGASNTCSAATLATLRVEEPAARGCEVLLVEAPGTSLSSVGFKDGVQGAFVREAPRVAVTFVAGADASIADAAVELRLAGPASGLTLQKASCVDARGQRLPAATLSIR